MASSSTGEVGRRTLLAALGAGLAGWTAADPADLRGALDAIDAAEAGVAARLRAVAEVVRGAAPLARRMTADLERLRRERAAAFARVTRPSAAPEVDRDLARLRDAARALVRAHAEAVPFAPDAEHVDLLARHLVTVARQATIVDLWLEADA